MRNFRRHRDFTVELSRGVTSLVGPTNSGKSSVIRAIKWVAFNRPLGSSVTTHGEEETRVDLTLVSGAVISRIRGVGKNLYKIGRKAFTAFGVGVPEEVEALLNLSQDNFQDQHSPAFWLSLPPPEASRQLNRVVSLDLIDASLARVSSEVTAAKSSLTKGEAELGGAKLVRDSLSWATLADDKLRAAEEGAARLSALHVRTSSLSSVVEDALSLASELENAAEASAGWGNAVSTSSKALDTATRAESLYTLVQKLQEAETLSESKLPSTAEVSGITDSVTLRGLRIDLLERLLSEHSETEAEVCEGLTTLREARRELRSLGACPLCGGNSP